MIKNRRGYLGRQGRGKHSLLGTAAMACGLVALAMPMQALVCPTEVVHRLC